MKYKTCNVCKSKGNLANTCRKGGGGAAAGGSGSSGGSGSGGSAKPPVLAIRPKLSFTTKLDKATEGAKGMVVEEVLPHAIVEGSMGDVEWLGDSGASRHVCNDMSLKRNVKVREDPIALRQLSGQLEVYVTGTIKLECKDKEGVLVILQLYNTLYIP